MRPESTSGAPVRPQGSTCALEPQAHLQIPLPVEKMAQHPQQHVFSKLPITAVLFKQPYAVIISPPRTQPPKCHNDTRNTHRIPKNLSNPLLFAQKREKNRPHPLPCQRTSLPLHSLSEREHETRSLKDCEQEEKDKAALLIRSSQAMSIPIETTNE